MKIAHMRRLIDTDNAALEMIGEDNMHKLIVVAETLRVIETIHGGLPHAHWCDQVNTTGMQGFCNCGVEKVQKALDTLEAE